MRSFEERLAQIQKRSKAILIKRKRRRILTGCIALLVCGGVCVALWAPDRGTEGMPNRGTILYASPGDVFSSNVTVGGSVKVTGEGISWRYSAAENVQKISALLKKAQITDNGAVILESYEDNQGTEGYTITVTDSEGIQTEYILRRGLLTNCTTKETFAVPEMELSELMRLLGISTD